MKTKLVSSISKKIPIAIKKHSPEILTGVGIAGMIAGTVLAVKQTPKALELMGEKKEELGEEKLTVIEVVKTTWKCFLPIVVIDTISIICLIGADSVNLKRNMALMTTYTLSETALKEYKDKAIEIVGEKKNREIIDAVAKDKISQNPVSKQEVIVTGKGKVLCYETLSGRYFESDINTLRTAESVINQKLINENYALLNEFYYEIGLGMTDIGDDIGWEVSRGPFSLDVSSLVTEDGQPCLVIGYEVKPNYHFCD